MERADRSRARSHAAGRTFATHAWLAVIDEISRGLESKRVRQERAIFKKKIRCFEEIVPMKL
ncbi:MAG: hypothetical protein ACK5XN_37065 [Bacteroidota bacterium]